MARSDASRFLAALRWLQRLFRREPESPEDPHSYVGAPHKPRTPLRGAAAVADLPEE